MNERITDFILEQVDQIRRGGISVLSRKVCTILLAVPALLGAVLVRLLRPFIIIKFGRLFHSRIGHFAGDTEIYLCERDASMHNHRGFDVFYYDDNTHISNYQLKKMWERTLYVCGFAKYVDRINRLFPGAQRHIIPMSSTRDVHGLFGRIPPHLSFTAEEECFGQKELKRIGLSDSSPFVCFNARDSAYLDTVLPQHGDWEYHSHRDSNVYNYLPAAEKLGQKGYYVIRMGSVVAVKESLNTANPMLIDYAKNYRTDFLDIYLGAKCRFFICDTAGIYAIPAIFRRPIVWVNFIPLEYVHAWGKDYLFIPKKLWVKKERRFLTFREILNSGIGRFSCSRQYEQLGIEVIENSPEEITALAMEMDERLKGIWHQTEEDEELQQRFWSLFKPSELNRVFLSRIGAEFLRQNRELLE